MFSLPADRCLCFKTVLCVCVCVCVFVCVVSMMCHISLCDFSLEYSLLSYATSCQKCGGRVFVTPPRPNFQSRGDIGFKD